VFYSKAYESGHAEGHFVPLQTDKKCMEKARRTESGQEQALFCVRAAKWLECVLQ
jgi:hypothetical protein